jgi:hypothetical protein
MYRAEETFITNILTNTRAAFFSRYINFLQPILIYTQQDATLHSSFYLETALHVLGGTTTNHQERKQLYLQRLVFVTL